jgi:site-specific recombinase XerD
MDNIIFKIDKPSSEKSIILMVYRFDAKKLTMSTGITIPVDVFDAKTKRINKSKIRFNWEYESYNKVLDNHELALRNALAHFRTKNINPSVVELKEKTLSLLGKEDKNESEFSPIVSKFITQQMDRIKDQQKATHQGYNQLLNHLSSFKNGKTLEFRDLNQKRLEDFMNHMKKSISPVTNKPYSKSNINKIQRRLVAIIGKASEYGIEVDQAYKNRSWKIAPSSDEISGNDVVLSPDEIKLLEDTHLESRLDRIRDLFLIGIYTGQRFSDFSRLNVDSVFIENDRNYITIIQKKGNVKVRIPYSDKIRNIFEKYKGYPPPISEQKFNAGVKEVCKAIGLTQKVSVYIDVPDQNVTEIIKEKWECVSSHTARRTFCTNNILNGVPPSMVMKISGHKNLKTLSRYVRINFNNQISEDVMFKHFG